MALILVVDDEPEIRCLLQLMLTRSGHQVLDAADGVSALDRCAVQCPDLVFCDIFMPGMEGLETMKTIRKRYPKTKIVAMSGGAEAVAMDFLSVAEMIAADLVLPKPLMKDKVLQAVERLIW
jgi:CheY-like chemotaxis protein